YWLKMPEKPRAPGTHRGTYVIAKPILNWNHLKIFKVDPALNRLDPVDFAPQAAHYARLLLRDPSLTSLTVKGVRAVVKLPGLFAWTHVSYTFCAGRGAANEPSNRSEPLRQDESAECSKADKSFTVGVALSSNQIAIVRQPRSGAKAASLAVPTPRCRVSAVA